MKKRKKIILTILVIILVLAILLTTLFITRKQRGQLNTIEETTSKQLGVTDVTKTESWDTTTLTILEDTSTTNDNGDTVTMYVPIPAGYVASKATGEDTVSVGLVIYEGTEEVTDSNVDTAKTTRNQYVWIPCDASTLYWTDTNGKKYSIRYEFSSTGMSSSEVTYEPAIQSGGKYAYEYYYEDYYLDRYYSDLESQEELLADMQTDYNEMIESIETYGGYYIGRYELGDSTTTTASTSRSGFNQEPIEAQGYCPYNNITWYQVIDLCKKLAGENDNVATTMIWGCLWDNTLIYLVESGEKEYSEIVDSTTWGNHKDSTEVAATGSGSLRVTGYSEYWKAQNIYDLAGNVKEWTYECYASSGTFSSVRACRGGCYYNISSTYPASVRSSSGGPGSYTYDLGTRAILYLK